MAQPSYPQELPASPAEMARARAANRANPNRTFFTPHQAAMAARMHRANNPLGFFGDKVEGFLKLRGMGQQLAGMFDPRTRGGIANIASLFAGGPEGDSFAGEMPPTTEEILQRYQPAGEFHAYGRLKGGEHVTGSPLDRGVEREGPIRPGRGYNPSIRKMVEGAHTNPFMRASRGAADDQLNRLSQLEHLRQEAARSMVHRAKLDEHLNAAPMSGKVGQRYPEHDATLLHGPSEIAHPHFIKSMLQRRAFIRSMHSHN